MLGRFFIHGSNAVLIFACVAAVGLEAAGVRLSLAWALGGAGLFYLSEYGTHRFLFHAPPSRFGWVRHFQHRLHYDHHEDPARLDLLFLPLWYVLPNAVAIAAVAYGISGQWRDAVSVLAGASAALLHYEWVHYLAHIPYRPRTGVGRYMKKYHLWHHYKNEHLWFGVSNPAMDHLVGTYLNPESAARSATVRVLHKS